METVLAGRLPHSRPGTNKKRPGVTVLFIQRLIPDGKSISYGFLILHPVVSSVSVE